MTIPITTGPPRDETGATIAPKDGGPAFPTHVERYFNGMTLRDYFAAAALSGFLGREGSIREAAEAAYLLADAMLAERAK